MVLGQGQWALEVQTRSVGSQPLPLHQVPLPALALPSQAGPVHLDFRVCLLVLFGQEAIL